MAGRRLAFNSPSTPLHGRDQPLSASPQTGEKTLLNAISGLSRQLTRFAADVSEQNQCTLLHKSVFFWSLILRRG